MAIKKCASGRQKITIQKIPHKSNLQVTFFKRRLGLFKKAGELSTLCGVGIAMIVFSPANKAFSFGYPGVDSIIDRFLTRKPSHVDSSISVHQNYNICNLNMQLTQLLSQLEIEKKREEELDQARKARQREFWWENPIDELDLVGLQQLMFSLKELQKDVSKHNTKILMDQTSFSSSSTSFEADHGFRPYDFAFKNKVAGAGTNAVSSSIIPTNSHNLIYPTYMDGFKFIS